MSVEAVGESFESINKEDSLTEAQLGLEALQGRYYDCERRDWQPMGWAEWLVRTIASPFGLMESVRGACLRHSWQSIEKLETIPCDIARRIDDLFLDSLMRTNPRSAYSDSIGRIFCKAHPNARKQMDIQQHPAARSFAVFQNQHLLYRVASSAYGQLDFYAADDRKLFNNDHDSLWDEKGKRIAAIKLAVDYPSLRAAMEISDGKDQLLMNVEQNKSKELLVFRKAMTNQLLAVAVFSRHGKSNWSITLLAPNLDEKRHLFVLGALKYSQHYHFGNPDNLCYVKGIPQHQIFRKG